MLESERVRAPKIPLDTPKQASSLQFRSSASFSLLAASFWFCPSSRFVLGPPAIPVRSHTPLEGVYPASLLCSCMRSCPACDEVRNFCLARHAVHPRSDAAINQSAPRLASEGDERGLVKTLELLTQAAHARVEGGETREAQRHHLARFGVAAESFHVVRTL